MTPDTLNRVNRRGAKAPGTTTSLEAHELLMRLNRDKRPNRGA